MTDKQKKDEVVEEVVLPAPLDEAFCIMTGQAGDPCPACGGSGKLTGKDEVEYMCMNCNGGGEVNIKRILVIHTGIVHAVRTHVAPAETVATVSVIGLELPEDAELMKEAKVFGNLPVRATWTTEGVMGDGIFLTMEAVEAKKQELDDELKKAAEEAKAATQALQQGECGTETAEDTDAEKE